MDEFQNARFTKFRSMARVVSRSWSVCGALTLLVLMPGCDPCTPNPFDNGLACDGLETCTVIQDVAVRTAGTPKSCDFPTFCTEPTGACVDPCDGADCSDGNDCTTDTCTTKADGTASCSSDTACDDADACTEGDVCGDDGECAGTAVKCAAGEVCADGICVCADDTACDDGNSCTGTETCDVETGECVAGTPVDCDDGEFCNGAETCEPNAETGEPVCVAGTDPCAEEEVCDEDTDDCLSAPPCTVDADCNDMDPCTDDFCGDGFCDATDVVCDDGDDCTVNSCDRATGDCGADPLCDDGDDCTTDNCDGGVCDFVSTTVCDEGFTCNPANGLCQDDVCTGALECDDGDLCTTGICTAGSCDFVPMVCDQGESCNADTGACDAGDDTPVQVDVLQIGNFYYPTGLFSCGAMENIDPMISMGCPNGSGCDGRHWHSFPEQEPVSAIAAVMDDGQPIDNTITDPDRCRCGHGKDSEITRTMIAIDGVELAVYLLAEGLDELPVAGACP